MYKSRPTVLAELCGTHGAPYLIFTSNPPHWLMLQCSNMGLVHPLTSHLSLVLNWCVFTYLHVVTDAQPHQ